jgi:hypothetical protein
MAFGKLLKKYRKWTGSTSLSTRFKNEVASRPDNFDNKSLEPLAKRVAEVLKAIRDQLDQAQGLDRSHQVGTSVLQ